MLNNPIQKAIFHLTSQVTTWFPRGGAKFFDTVIPPLLGNRFLVDRTDRKNLAILKSVKKFERILVIPDIHIGDAVMLQGAVTAFRDFFPNARIDYVIKKSVACLLEGHPDVSNLYPVFTGGIFPNEADIAAIRKIATDTPYDLCFNCSPFFGDKDFPKGQKLLSLLTVAPRSVRNDIDRTGINHFMFLSYDFPHKLLSQVAPQVRPGPFQGAKIILSAGAAQEAEAFLTSTGLPKDKPLLLFNPDTASRFTRVPFEKQVEFLKLLARQDLNVLVGTAFVEKGIEERLMTALSEEERSRMRVVPLSLSLEGYTALTDLADVFVSGDTGPLHMAASRKLSRSGGHTFRNRTFVVSVFGATPVRSAGYDSNDPLLPPANQDAPSKAYVSESPCRNITCVNKMAKTCRTVRCFEVLDVQRIAGDIQKRLGTLKNLNLG